MGRADLRYESHMGNGKQSETVVKMVKCPGCKKEVPFEGNPFRPFCSRGCKGIDLIGWANESYRIEGRPDEDDHNEETN